MHAIAGDRARAFARGIAGPLLLALGGCAVATPFALHSSGPGLPPQTVVAMPAAPRIGSEQFRFGAALEQAFAARAVKVSADGRYLADYALSLRDAEGGLTTAIDAKDRDAVVWKSAPRDGYPLDRCKAQRMRATLVLLDRQSGAMVYRGEGEATDCNFTDSAMTEVAKALVADALARTNP
jgi:hypothetical protein